MILNAVGGECLDNCDALKQDTALQEPSGHGLPSPEAARKFLYKFHGETQAVAQQAQFSGKAREENARLRGWGQANVDVLQELGRRLPDQKIATID